MKIKTRLQLWFTLLAAWLLITFAGLIYWASFNNRDLEFYHQLEKEAIVKAKLVLEAKVSPLILQQIYKSNNQVLNEVEVAVYTKDFDLIYHDDVVEDRVKETPEMISLIDKQGRVYQTDKDWQIVGLKYPYQGQDYIVTATSYDVYGYNTLTNLWLTIWVFSTICLLLTFVLGGVFARKILSPIQKINKQIKSISVANLHARIPVSNDKDELGQLATNCNSMLDRLENSFISQKEFVSNISHELRTPLSAIIAESQLALEGKYSPEAYQKVLYNILDDSNKIVSLSNSLLDLAKASYDSTQIVFKQVRLDEIILDAIHKTQRKNPQAKFNFVVDPSIEKDTSLIIYGNAYLLEVAIVNLLDNACKFSGNKLCSIFLKYQGSELILSITDQGPGIDFHEIPNIFKPFYRTANTSQISGSGIGLALTKKIIELHKAHLTLESSSNKGSCFSISFQNNSQNI